MSLWFEPLTSVLPPRWSKALLKKAYRRHDLKKDQKLLRRYAAKGMMPHIANIQISRRCNLKCSMCGWAAWGRNKGFMSVELYKRVLSELKANSIKTIGLTNPQGEPLLSPHAAECIQLAIDEGFKVIINTNCTTLGDRHIAVLTEAAKSGRFSIQASFAGYDKATHESVYVGSKFEDSSVKLAKLNASLKAVGQEDRLTVNGISMDPTATMKHVEYIESLGIDRSRIQINLPDNFAGIVDVGTKDAATGMFSFKSDLDVRSLRLCGLLVTQLLVYDDGTVSACACRDSEGVMTIGDLKTQSLKEIRESPEFGAMIKGFMDRNLEHLPLCQKCDIPYGDAGYPVMYKGELRPQ